MLFEMPKYHHPDFTKPEFVNAPDVKTGIAEQDGVVPEYYHSTSMYPEYFKIDGKWVLAEESRMDSSVVLCDDGPLPEVYGDAGGSEEIYNRDLSGNDASYHCHRQYDPLFPGNAGRGDSPGLSVHRRCR